MLRREPRSPGFHHYTPLSSQNGELNPGVLVAGGIAGPSVSGQLDGGYINAISL